MTYAKQTWTDGVSVANASRLNHIEDGIEAAASNIREDTQFIHQGFLIMDTSDLNDDAAPEIHYKGYNGAWIQGMDVVNAPTSRDFVFVAMHPEYMVNDAATSSGSAVLTSPAEGGFTSSMVGTAISGPGIPVGTTVASVQSTTSLTMSANATATATGVRITANRSNTGVDDIFYMKHRGGLQPTLGLGVGVPGEEYRLTIGPGYVGETAMGGVYIWKPSANTGHALRIDSGSSDYNVTVNSDFHITGHDGWSGASVVFRAASGNNNVIALVDQNKGTNIYGFDFNGNNMKFRHLGGVDYLEFTGWNSTVDIKVKANANDDVEITNSAKGVILRSPNGTRYRLTVADNGTLSTTQVT